METIDKTATTVSVFGERTGIDTKRQDLTVTVSVFGEVYMDKPSAVVLVSYDHIAINPGYYDYGDFLTC